MDMVLQLIDIDTSLVSQADLAPGAGSGERSLTEARDIFALGLVLWALAEELPYFNR